LTKSSGYLGKEIKKYLVMKWTGPFLLIPILFIASLVVESWMQKYGIIAYIPVGKRSGFSVWRIVMIACMVGTPISTLFMGDSWKKVQSVESFNLSFFGTVLTCFMVVFLVMIMASFVILPPLGVPLGTVAANVFIRAAITGFWAASTAALCSAVSVGPGGAVLSVGLFSLGLFPGLSGTSMSWWFMGPLGDMVSSRPWAVYAVLGHSVAYLFFGWLILKKLSR